MKITKEIENKITEMLAEMTVEEKIGQMQQISLESFRPEVFERFRKLGGGSFDLIGDVIERQFQQSYNYNLGASLSLVLMVLILISMAVMNRFSGDEEGMVI